ncbi:MFS transporter [Bacillus sp. FJAT-42376]|uniref:MDR family MFS transporter n=1 Tax=Bacillus sp. FJAT-42376 TaxID=2014076 RepID=UPI000F4D3A30|nr:MFS transporter [Bacillus sp. FJAT-42376]AZB42077.1 MFS transporter [Bacillus sp. FJAT-42376]
MFKELHPNIKIRIYTSFLSRLVGSMVFPFMAIYFAREINAVAAGILLLIQVVVQFLSGFYGGYLADTWGRKKVMVAGEWMKVISTGGMLLANSPWYTSAWVTFVMLVLLGISMGIGNPAAEAMLVDVSTKETRTMIYSINYWTINLSIMLALIIGGWFFESNFFELLLSLLVISIFILWITKAKIEETFIPEKKSPGSFSLKPVFSSYVSVMKDVPFMLFTIGGIAILSIEFQRNNFMAIRLEEEIPKQMISIWGSLPIEMTGVRMMSLLTVENTLLIVLLTAAVNKWLKHKSEQKMMYIGFIVFGFGYSFLAFSNHIAVLTAAVFIMTIGELIYVPTRQTLMADMVDESQRGAYMAVNGIVFQAGKIFGVFGIMAWQAIGGIGMAVLILLFAFAGVLCSRWAIVKRSRRDAFLAKPDQAV